MFDTVSFICEKEGMGWGSRAGKIAYEWDWEMGSELGSFTSPSGSE